MRVCGYSLVRAAEVELASTHRAGGRSVLLGQLLGALPLRQQQLIGLLQLDLSHAHDARERAGSTSSGGGGGGGRTQGGQDRRLAQGTRSLPGRA